MATDTHPRFVLIYGTQTGQAKAIAEEIHEKCLNIGFLPDIFNLELTEKKFSLEKETCAVIITSTTGDGDPPDTATKFFRRLKKKTLPNTYLANLNYAILGLGDSNYTSFCKAGKTLDGLLQSLGAKRFYDPGWADDAVGLEICVEPWMDGLFPALGKFLGCSIDMDLLQSVVLNSSYKENEKSTELDNEKSSSSDVVKDVNTLLQADTNGALLTNGELVSSSNIQQQFNGVNDNNKSNTVEELNKPTSALNDAIETDKTSNGVEVNSNHTASNDFPTETGGITASPLKEQSLTIPALSPPYIQVDYSKDKFSAPDDTNSLKMLPNCSWPSSAGPVTMATIKSAHVMTHPEAVKTTLCVSLKLPAETDFDYLPGDSISVLCHNDPDEVDRLLARLGVCEYADNSCSISILEGTKKRNASVPVHITPNTSLRHIFLHCVDIREPPKKALFRVLVEHTSIDTEKRRLQELCSKQGAADYTKYVRETGVSILDVLMNFVSCQPPVARLLEHLPRLSPRPYSLCSSPLTDGHDLDIAFNIVNIPEGEGRLSSRVGVCTGMLDRLTKKIQTAYQGPQLNNDLSEGMGDLKLNSILVPVYKRTAQSFHVPDDPTYPVIMVGPGTGVAPFIGFLKHRHQQRQSLDSPDKYGDTWLFYGCRNKDKDYLFRKELEEFESNGTLTKLCVCFSRDERESDSPKYVQDNIRQNAQEIVELLDKDSCQVFVCGDATHMAKDVNDAFCQVIHSVKGCGQDEANKHLMKMRLYKKYIEDVWT